MKRANLWLVAAILALCSLQAVAQTPVRACAKLGGPDNYPPTANDDYAAWTTSVVTVDVLANDTDIDHDTITITAVSNATGGTPSVVNSGTAVSFAPAAGATSGQFRYTITDGHTGHTSTATVFLTSLKNVDFSYSCKGTICTFTAQPLDPNGIRGYQWDFDDQTPPVPWTGINIYKEFPHLDEGATHTYNVSLGVDYLSGEHGQITKAVTLVGPQYEVTWKSNTTLGMTVPFWLLTSNLPASTSTTKYRYYLAYPEEGTRDEFVGDPVNSGFPFGVVINHEFSTPGDHLIQVETSREDLVIDHWVASEPHTFGSRYVTVFNAPPDANFTFTSQDGKTFVFDPSQSHDDTLPFTADQYDFLWDFGDGQYGTSGFDAYHIAAPISHTYGPTGSYTVTLTIRDHRANLSDIYTKSINVADVAPVPRISVHCHLLDCTFGSEPSTDDNNNIVSWLWTFPDGATASGPTVQKSFAAPGCVTVSLVESDGTGHTSTPGTQTAVVGPPIVTQSGGVTVDAHVQSFNVNGDVGTSDGNLNGIAEPGETVVVEPTWAATTPVLAMAGDVTLPGDPAGTTRNDDAVFVGNQASYSVPNGKADCWTGGNCYAVRFPADRPNNQHTGVHRDYVVPEVDPDSGQPLAGAGFTIHLGATFSDVTPTHWAYPFVESMLHAGFDNGCGAGLYCPTTTFKRSDAAVRLLKGEHGASYQPPACTSAPFTDVPCTSSQAAWIAQLKNEGLASGTTFSPGANLTRADAAVFLLKAKLGASHVPPSCTTDFGDVRCPGHALADWISEAKALGISNGCTATEFCPDDPVDRAQSAALFARAFGLRIDGKQCVTDAAYDVVPTHPNNPPIVSLTFAPSPATVGSTSTGTITLGAPPATAATIPLSIDSNAASVPANVVVAAYATTGTFTVTPGNPAVRTTTHITATYQAYPKTTALDICTLAPTITTQPASVIINAGQSTTLSVSASGGGALTYQWYTGTSPTGSAIQNANGPTLTVTPNTTTSYWVNVTNACSSRPSNTATVTVCVPPAITAQPFTQIISWGTSTTLSVTAAGSGTLSYQWYEGTAPSTAKPVGTNSPSYTTGILTANKSYWVRVTGTCNGTQTADSTTAAITVVTQITRVQTTAATAQSQTSVTATWPQPTHAGNLLVASLSGAHSALVGNLNPPAGWQVATSYEWNNIKTILYYYPNSPAGRTTEMFTTASGVTFRDLVLQVAEYTWIATSPLDRTNFDGANAPRFGQVASGTTQTTSQAAELVVSALSTYASTLFTNPTNSFTKVQEQGVPSDLTAALHERIVTATGAYGHEATVDSNVQWLGLVASFRGGTAPPLPITSLTFAPSPMVSGGTSTGTVTLSAAPATNVTIPLTIDSGAATVPANVTVNAGQTIGTFTVTAGTVSTRTTVNVSATYNGYTLTTALDVCPPAPTITTQPTSRTINSGQSTTLTVAATGSGTLTYQWYAATAPSPTNPVGTGTSLTVTPNTTTSYWVAVSNGCGFSASNTATVTVCAPPVITTQPASQTIASGTSATLSVGVSGSAPLSFQWYEGAAPSTLTPVGTNSSTFTTPALTTSKSYWVRVTSTCNGTVTTDSATATVTVSTQITRVQTSAASAQSQTSITANWPAATHAGNLLVAVYSAANNSVIGNFTAPSGWQLATSYEWNNIKTSIYYYPNSPAGHTSETFSTAGFRDQVLQLAEYASVDTVSPLDRTAFNGDNAPTAGSVSTGTTSTTAAANELVVTSLVTYAASSFTSPSNSFAKVQEQVVGSDLTAALHERVVSSTGAYGHSATVGGNTQWVGAVATFKAATPPPAIVSLTFSPSPVTGGSTSTGTLTLGTAPGSSTAVPLTIDNPSAATIPASVTVNAGQTTGTFTVTGANVAVRTTTNITATYLGATKTTQLDVCTPPPTITVQPTSRTINSGQSTTFSVTASGGGTLTYQWYQGTAPSTTTPVGTNSSSLTVTPATTASYWVKVSNACGSTNSSTATVTVCLPVGIATQPASQTIATGTTATLSVTASGSGPLSYQWYEGASGNTTTLVGTNSSSFTTPALTTTKSYWVRVTSTCNGTTLADSATATITVVSGITRVQTVAASAQSQTSVTANWPTATHAGNLLVAVFSAANNSTIGNFTPPSGWQLGASYEWNNVKTSIYYYPNCPAGRTSETFSTASFRDQVLQLAEYSGVAAAAPLDRTAFDGNGSAAGSVDTGTTSTTSQSKELLITGISSYSATSFTSPTNSFVKVQEQTVGSDLTAAMFERIVTASGAYGHAASTGSSAQWVGLIVTLKSADTTP